MADMVDLKRRPEDPEDKKFFRDPDEPEAYYPLTMYLDDVEIEKLGVGEANVGDVLMLTCKVKVISKSQYESDSSPSTKSMSLAVTEAAASKAEGRSQADRLFGD